MSKAFKPNVAFLDAMKLLKQAHFNLEDVTEGERHITGKGQISLDGKPETITITKDKKRNLYSIAHTFQDHGDPQTLTFTELAKDNVECKINASYGEVISMMIPTTDAKAMADLMNVAVDKKLTEVMPPKISEELDVNSISQ